MQHAHIHQCGLRDSLWLDGQLVVAGLLEADFAEVAPDEVLEVSGIHSCEVQTGSGSVVGTNAQLTLAAALAFAAAL